MRTGPDNRHPFHAEPHSSSAPTASTQGGLRRRPSRCALREDTGRGRLWGLESCILCAQAPGAGPRPEVPFAIWSVASSGLDFPRASSTKGTAPGPRQNDGIAHCSERCHLQAPVPPPQSTHDACAWEGKGTSIPVRVLCQGLANAVPRLEPPESPPGGWH